MAFPDLTDSAQLLTFLLGGGLLGSLATLGIQHRLGRSTRQADLKLDAYTSYLMAVARASHPQGKEDFVGSRRDLVYAKLRVLAVGSSAVIGALRFLEERNHELESQGFKGNFGTDEAWGERLAQVVHEIRRDLASEDKIDLDAIHSIILKPR